MNSPLAVPDPLASLIVAGLLAVLGAWLIWPRVGLIARWQRARRVTERTRSEDALKHIFHCDNSGRSPTVQSVAGALHVSMNDAAELLTRMEQTGLVEMDGADFRLTARGHASALHIIRAHRLWERYLADDTGVAEAEWHEQAEQHEHMLSPVEADALSAHLGNPTHDPHGDPIPTPTGEVVSHGGQPLTAMKSDASVRIVHLEDEPASLYAQLVASGLYPGMEGRLIENSSQRVLFWAGGDQHVLAPIVAANVWVVPLKEEVVVTAGAGERLDSLQLGESGEVLGISPTCRRVERRRMMDLGILPGTVIAAEMRSPGMDPIAYRIRGALIALRDDQANLIHIRKLAGERN